MVHEEIPVSGISNPVAPGTPNVARMYDYYLGGKDNYAADREAAERLIALVPDVRVMARENRAFLRRAVRFLVAERGVVRFLDIGTGIPTVGNTHEVAQDVAIQPEVAVLRDLVQAACGGASAGGSQGPALKSCRRASSLSMPHLAAVDR